MKKFIILILAVLLPAGAYAADTDSGSPPLTKKEQRRTLRGYKGFVELGAGITLQIMIFGSLLMMIDQKASEWTCLPRMASNSTILYFSEEELASVDVRKKA